MRSIEFCDLHVDVAGLHCPQPVINCKAALARMMQGQILQLVTSDRNSLQEIPKLVEFLGDELIGVETRGKYQRYTIRRNTTRGKRCIKGPALFELPGLNALLNALRGATPREAY